MKITFNQYHPIEKKTEKSYADAEYQEQVNSKLPRQTDAVAFGKNISQLLLGNTEKGKSFIQLQEEAQFVDVGVQQDYMTLMSNTLSEEDYAKLQEEGFDFSSMSMEEAVTIVDKIKAELVRSGKTVPGYTDDLDFDTLAATLGSVTLAAALEHSFTTASLPIQKENLDVIRKAWNMTQGIGPMTEGIKCYMIDNSYDPEIWNLYLAENSGAKNASTVISQEKSWDEMMPQIKTLIEQSGYVVDEEKIQDAVWLLDRELPLTKENLVRLDELKKLELPVSESVFAAAVSEAILEGKNPIHGNLTADRENMYRKADKWDQYYHSQEIPDLTKDQITARRQLEEIRLRMTAEINVRLIKSGFSIDTAPMEKLLEALKKAESELAQIYFPGDNHAVEKWELYTDAQRKIEEIPTLPASVVGEVLTQEYSLDDFYHRGKELQVSYEKAGERYEAFMTSPRSDLGDSIKKAFVNVDEILDDLGMELTEENRKVIRILGYNRMPMNAENFEAVKNAETKVSRVIEKLTPAVTLNMIREGWNPLEKSFSELEDYFMLHKPDFREEAEGYSKFLYNLERNNEITNEERESYIGIYRLVRQIERSDGAAVGSLVHAQAELSLSNLLSAVRSNKAKNIDLKADHNTGLLKEVVYQAKTISEQIGKAFEKEYYAEQLGQLKTAMINVTMDSTALLARGEMPANAENILAAEALLNELENPFGTPKKEKRGEELLEKLANPEEFIESYGEFIENTQNLIQEELLSSESSLDVRRFQLQYKQLTIASRLSEKQEYYVPMYIGEQFTKVHVILQSQKDESGTVDIFIKLSPECELNAQFQFKNQTLNGKIDVDSEGEVMKAQRIADTFYKDAGERWRLGNISIEAERSSNDVAGAGKDANVKNTDLYEVALVFLQSVKKEEVSNEN